MMYVSPRYVSTVVRLQMVWVRACLYRRAGGRVPEEVHNIAGIRLAEPRVSVKLPNKPNTTTQEYIF